jgi:hypothetical protein
MTNESLDSVLAAWATEMRLSAEEAETIRLFAVQPEALDEALGYQWWMRVFQSASRCVIPPLPSISLGSFSQ